MIETGGWGDAVVPYHSPAGTEGEWIEDPLGVFGQTYTGPGFRVPSWIVSPWTRGGRVFGEHCDHNSQILFVEKWLAAKGYSDVELTGMATWRRNNMCDFVNAFDFANVSFSLFTKFLGLETNYRIAGLQRSISSYCRNTSH